MTAVTERASRAEPVSPNGAPGEMPALRLARDHAFALMAGAILFLAAVLRFWRLDLAEFKGDELHVTQLAFALARHGQWPERGILSSLGTYNSPLFVYVEALPALFWASPLALTAFVAALNVAAVAMAIVFARRYFGAVAALVAGLLFATAPWAVIYSRKIWEQDALPPVVILFFFALFAVVVDRKPRALLLCGVTASVAIQLHPSAIVLPIVAFIALLIWPRRFPWRANAAAVAAGLLAMLPYLIAEWRHAFADWHNALTAGTTTHLGPALGLLVGLINWAQSASGWQVLGIFTAGGAGYHEPGFVTVANGIVWALLVAATAHLVARCRPRGIGRGVGVGVNPLSAFGISPPILGESQVRTIGGLSGTEPRGDVPGQVPSSPPRSSPPALGPSRPEGTRSSTWARSGERAPRTGPAGKLREVSILLALWLLVPPLLLGVSGLLTYPHYFIAGYPAPFLAIGVLVAALVEQRRWPRVGAVAVVVLVAVLNVATVAQVLLSADRTPFPHDYGLPLAFDTAIAQTITQDAAGRPVALIVDPAFRDGQEVIGQFVAWDAPLVGQSASGAQRVSYWLLPAGTAPPAGSWLLLKLGPPVGPPVAALWTGDRASVGTELR